MNLSKQDEYIEARGEQHHDADVVTTNTSSALLYDNGEYFNYGLAIYIKSMILLVCVIAPSGK